MGIIAHCYYDNGFISKKFQFVLKYILGSRNPLQFSKKATLSLPHLPEKDITDDVSKCKDRNNNCLGEQAKSIHF